MRSSRPRKARAQDDARGVRWDPHAGKHRSGWPIKESIWWDFRI